MVAARLFHRNYPINLKWLDGGWNTIDACAARRGLTCQRRIHIANAVIGKALAYRDLTTEPNSALKSCNLVRSYPLEHRFATLPDAPRCRRTLFTESSAFSRESAVAPKDISPTYRWWGAVPPANLVHLSIGSVYVYSMWTPGMCQTLGVITAAAPDWTHADVLPVFSTSAVCLGLTTARFGQWVENVGPRTAAIVGSAFWSCAMVTTAAGIQTHNLGLVYMGWGLFGGIGWGLMYLSPVTTVMKWFPDRRGLATGIALSAFGAGAALAPTFIQSLIDYYAVAPEYIGPLAELSPDLTTNEYVTLEALHDGTQVVSNSSLVGTPGESVVVATELQAAQFPGGGAPSGAGAYRLGTGSTGVAPAMATLGVAYGATGALGARCMTLPHNDWRPETTNAPFSNDSDKTGTQSTITEEEHHNIGLPVDYVTKSTTQFPLLWLSVFGNATGGLALLSSSKLMIGDLWGTCLLPDLVTASFCTSYVSALGLGMAAGRFGWSALSDSLGNRKNTYAIFGLGIPIIGLCPTIAHTAVTMASAPGVDSTSSLLPLLSAFCGGSVLAITFYGGVFSVLPAYIADLFGQKHAGAIHGKLLTAWAASAVVGPLGLAFLRGQAIDSAIQDLLTQVDNPEKFHHFFGCSLDDSEAIQTMIDAKTITIARLMEVLPPSTVDPTPFLYDSTCYTAAALMTVSFVANMLIQPINVPDKLKELEGQRKSDASVLAPTFES